MTTAPGMRKHKNVRMGRLRRKYGDWALVTGASAGIGKAIAAELAKEGMNLVIVARNEARLEEVKVGLEHSHGVSVRVVVADLTEPNAVEQIEDATEDLEIGVLVPNAGVEMSGEFVETDRHANARMVQLNIAAPMLLAHGYGRKMAIRGRGAILFLSSLFGYQGIPYVANYAATKAYILSLGEALNVEFGRRKVDVTVLSPGLTDTNMPAGMPVNFERIPMLRQSPAEVASFALLALGRKTSAVPGLLNKFYVFQNRVVPRMVPVRLFGFLLRNALTGDARVKPTLSLGADVESNYRPESGIRDSTRHGGTHE